MSSVNPINDPEKIYFWLALERIPRVGPLTIAKLIKSFVTPENILNASFKDLVNSGLSERLSSIIAEYHANDDEIRKDLRILEKTGTAIISRWDDDYPENLKHIYDPPALLFVRGKLLKEDTRAIGIVGTRNPTSYGLDMTRTLTRDFVRAGVTIISGLARGIDTECHKAALKADGRTIGVLGCGIDIVYPKENGPLIEEMADRGAVVSEFRPRIQPLATNFYRRNRIISGMSKGIVVVEAAVGSGSLITAKHAIEQNRDVFAVPGNTLNARAAGPHYLIKQGAGLVENAADVISTLFETTNQKVHPVIMQPSLKLDLDENSTKVMSVLELDPIPIDIICEAVHMDPGTVSGILLQLELNGYVRQLPGKLFSKIITNCE